jgi:hypothetical protein
MAALTALMLRMYLVVTVIRSTAIAILGFSLLSFGKCPTRSMRFDTLDDGEAREERPLSSRIIVRMHIRRGLYATTMLSCRRLTRHLLSDDVQVSRL